MTVYARNKRAHYIYEILESFEAGLSLEGWEVRSVRTGRMSLGQAHARLRGGEAWLVGAHIAPLPNSPDRQDATRTRKLLLHAKEILKLAQALDSKGTTLVPLKAYGKRGKIKIELALAKGRSKADKRSRILEELDRKEAEREARKGLGRH
ncbi:SsrA-binding protein SmpB [bacterium]|nr:SsrA-binding protein SmpB [bacterium]